MLPPKAGFGGMDIDLAVAAVAYAAVAAEQEKTVPNILAVAAAVEAAMPNVEPPPPQSTVASYYYWWSPSLHSTPNPPVSFHSETIESIAPPHKISSHLKCWSMVDRPWSKLFLTIPMAVWIRGRIPPRMVQRGNRRKIYRQRQREHCSTRVRRGWGECSCIGVMRRRPWFSTGTLSQKSYRLV